MSSAMYSKTDPSNDSTRRAPTTNESQRNAGRRSLSGKFRNLFRKNSSSPKRAAANDEPSPPVRQRSPSPPPVKNNNETPKLRTPTFPWPLGKKSKLTTTQSPPASTKSKSKFSRKSKQKPNPTTVVAQDIFPPTYNEKIVHRTTDLPHERVTSVQSYDSMPTKGFRDFMIIDQTNSRDANGHFSTDRSHSPSIERSRFHDSSNPYVNTSSTISKIEMIVNPHDENESTLTAAQLLASKTPLLPQETSIGSSSISTRPTHWNNFSSSIDNDHSKFTAPTNPYGNVSNRNPPRQTNSETPVDGIFTSSMHNNEMDRSWRNPGGSVPDAEMLTINNSNSSKPDLAVKYPWLTAIVEHHLRPFLPGYQSSSPTVNNNRLQRFEASTTTQSPYEQRQTWTSSPNNFHQVHDGYIRPLTPQKSTDTTMIKLNVEDLRNQTPPSTVKFREENSAGPIYRSSTTIYTREKHRYVDGGEIRTWSVREQEPPKILSMIENVYGQNRSKPFAQRDDDDDEDEEDEENYAMSYGYEVRQQQYPDKRSERVTRPVAIEQSQETLTSMSPVGNVAILPRHYTLKRSNSYDGLGILLSADVDTRLHHCIRDVEVDSPAYRAGLRRNDRIIAVNGVNVENVQFSDVLILIKQGLMNNNLQFTVMNESTLI